MDDINKLLLECKTIEEFKNKMIKDFIPSETDDQFSEITYQIDQDILANIFWMGRKKLLRLKN